MRVAFAIALLLLATSSHAADTTPAAAPKNPLIGGVAGFT
jgi:hypothetical protein